MATLNSISRQLTPPVHDGQCAEREVVEHKRLAGKRMALVPATLLAFSFIVPVAHSEPRPDTFLMQHGTVCQAVKASRKFVDYNQYGIYNLSTTNTATVECPVITTCAPDLNVCRLDSVFVRVYDRSTTANVSCTLKKLQDGITQSQETKSSVGGGPRAAAQQISFAPNSDSVSIWNMRCTLPPSQSGSFSHIAASS